MLHFLLRMYGSVVPRCLPLALLAGAEAAIARHYINFHVEGEDPVWQHPYSMAMFGTVLGFSLVMRIQIAYQRYWEGASNCHRASCKLVDAAIQLFAFDEVSMNGFEDSGLAFRVSLIHLISLMFAVNGVDMRQDDYLFERTDMMPTLSKKDPFKFRMQPSRTSGKQQMRESGRGSIPAWRKTTTDSGNACPSAAMLSAAPETVTLRGLLHARIDELRLKSRGSGAGQSGRKNSRRVSLVCDRTSTGSESPPSRKTSGRRGSRDSSFMFGKHPSVKIVQEGQPAFNSSEWMLKRGQLSALQYVGQTVFLVGSNLTKQELATANSFDVLGGVSQSERVVLAETPPGERVYLVHSWIIREVTLRQKAGGLDISPPLLSRTYHLLSEGLQACEDAFKIASVEFPFPIRQLIGFLILLFQGMAPLCIAAFMSSLPLVAILSFFVSLGYVALNETARELEMPFGVLANDLRARLYHRRLNSMLARLLDLWIPSFFEDETGEVDDDTWREESLGGDEQRTYSRKPRLPTPDLNRASSCSIGARMRKASRKDSLLVFPNRDSFQATSPCAMAAAMAAQRRTSSMERIMGASIKFKRRHKTRGEFWNASAKSPQWFSCSWHESSDTSQSEKSSSEKSPYEKTSRTDSHANLVAAALSPFSRSKLSKKFGKHDQERLFDRSSGDSIDGCTRVAHVISKSACARLNRPTHADQDPGNPGMCDIGQSAARLPGAG